MLETNIYRLVHHYPANQVREHLQAMDYEHWAEQIDPYMRTPRYSRAWLLYNRSGLTYRAVGGMLGGVCGERARQLICKVWRFLYRQQGVTPPIPEKEEIPVGLSDYLRYYLRKAGYRTEQQIRDAVLAGEIPADGEGIEGIGVGSCEKIWSWLGLPYERPVKPANPRVVKQYTAYLEQRGYTVTRSS